MRRCRGRGPRFVGVYVDTRRDTPLVETGPVRSGAEKGAWLTHYREAHARWRPKVKRVLLVCGAALLVGIVLIALG